MGAMGVFLMDFPLFSKKKGLENCKKSKRHLMNSNWGEEICSDMLVGRIALWCLERGKEWVEEQKGFYNGAPAFCPLNQETRRDPLTSQVASAPCGP